MSQTQAIRSPVRSTTNRRLLGVCGGFAEYYGIDPLVVRIAVVVLSIFGGLGVVLYLAGAAWLPEPGDTGDLLSGRRLGWVLAAALAALVILPSYVFGFGGDAFPISLAVLLVLGGLVVVMARRPAAAVAPPQPQMAADSAVAGQPEVDPAQYGTMPYPAAPPPAPQYPPPAPRPRSYLGGVALGAAFVWFGLAWLLNATDITSMSAVTIFGGSLLILGAGVLIGAWIGRARWLVLFALPLSLVVWGLSAVPESVQLGEAPDWLADGTGEVVVPVGEESFALGIGSATLDLSEWSQAPTGSISASVGVGQLLIRIPEGWNVVVNSEVGLGSIYRDDLSVAEGPDLAERLVFESSDPDAPSLIIDARVNLGEIRTDTIATQGALQ